MTPYLKDKSYYEDIHDVFTIRRCLEEIERWKECRSKIFEAEDWKDLSDEEKEGRFKWWLDLELFYIKGEYYQRKSSFVNELMSRDRARDEKFNSAKMPEDVACPVCDNLMKNILKELYHGDEETLRVLFFFECPKCGKRKGLFDDGQPYVSRPDPCPKCSQPIKTTIKEKGDVVTWNRKCPACGFSEKEVDDFKQSREERLKKEQEDRDLLEKYRSEFCLGEAEGLEYQQSVQRLNQMSEMVENLKKKTEDPVYQEVKKLKQLKITELEKLLSGSLAKEKYINLRLDKPEISQFVIVPFTIQDDDSRRKEHNSELKLQRLIKKSLDDTNWRLMSEGVSYRLGYLTGRLKGYEGKEDLRQLVARKGKKTEKT